MPTPVDQPLPVSFRKKTVNLIFKHLTAGDSCTVIGIGSVGKSNLLRFLQQSDLRQDKLGEKWKQYLLIYVDVNKLLEISPWGLFELMLHEMLIELTRLQIDKEVLNDFDKLHQRIIDPNAQHMALRYLDRAATIICENLGLHLVFLLDEFDSLCQTLNSRAFAALRALRDDHKYRLMYVVAARKELNRFRKDAFEIEHLEELITPNTIWLSAYCDTDARIMLERLSSRHGATLDPTHTDAILKATGGHPGLLRTAFHVPLLGSGDYNETLLEDQHVRDECQRIWRSLSADEQDALVRLATSKNAASIPSHTLNQLSKKGLLGDDWAASDELFSPVFKSYLQRESPPVGAHVIVDRAKHIVWVDEQKIEGLSSLEFKLIDYLEKHRDQVCSRDELNEYLYPHENWEGVNDNRLDSLLKRLRKAIPGYIQTVPKVGFKLDDGTHSLHLKGER